MNENTSETTVKRNSKGQLEKGSNLNPHGNPGAKHFKTLFKDALVKISEGNDESDDVLIVKKVIEKAKAGDLKAVDIILDRTDGKAIQEVTVDATVENLGDGLTKEQRDGLLKLLK